jgi:hypothetical protein
MIRIFKTTISPVVLYMCQTWSLALKEEHRLRVFGNRVLRMFGPRRTEVTGGWRRGHNEELHDLCSSPSIIRNTKSRRMSWVWHVARMAEKGACIAYWLESRRNKTTMKTKTWVGG